MARDFRKVLTGGLLVLGAAVPVLLAVEAAQQRTCDRACLLATIHSYVDALQAHNPAALTVARSSTFNVPLPFMPTLMSAPAVIAEVAPVTVTVPVAVVLLNAAPPISMAASA